jgi:hypothetical protein
MGKLGAAREMEKKNRFRATWRSAQDVGRLTLKDGIKAARSENI